MYRITVEEIIPAYMFEKGNRNKKIYVQEVKEVEIQRLNGFEVIIKGTPHKEDALQVLR